MSALRLQKRTLLLVAAVLFVSLAACKREAGPAIGALAPDFVLPRLDGTTQKLSNYRGSIVLVNMWATWCPPCIEEMPLLERIADDYRDRGLVVLALAGDDDPERVRTFIAGNSVSFEVLLDVGGAVGTTYGITGYPETFVVDREGRLSRKFVGPLPADAGRPSAELTRMLDALVGG